QCSWRAGESGSPEFAQTLCDFSLMAGGVNLARNEDLWSRTIWDSVLVSAYPPAFWLAASWWRLNREPLPARPPSVDWRLSHELGAANEGYVWPRVRFATDGESMQAWASPSSAIDGGQSVLYLDGLANPLAIPQDRFRSQAERFIDAVLSRLSAVDLPDRVLRGLWELVREESRDPDRAAYGNIEAEMGFDPGACPEAVVREALALAERMGPGAFSELAPVFKPDSDASPVPAIEDILQVPGLEGTPGIGPFNPEAVSPADPPWRRAVAAANQVRAEIGQNGEPVSTSRLCDLLGLRLDELERWHSPGRREAGLGVRESPDRIRFVLRKRRPVAQRFELARFLGDYVSREAEDGQWLGGTDLGTARQKYQRAFAAEFLCPLSALREFLDEDYSETAIEDASEHFQVGQRTVESLLVNNGLAIFPWTGEFAGTGIAGAFSAF
ncbi:MAG: ImmA/IrrE family metallo-endopeptidase, partial [Thermodesulfobacteriota bacterium]